MAKNTSRTEAADPAASAVPEGVDPRLDNRTGADRPPVETFPAKPQQVDGPDLMGQAEHTKAVLAGRDEQVGPRKGMFSPGPHGLSDEALREPEPNGDPAFGTEGVKGE